MTFFYVKKCLRFYTTFYAQISFAYEENKEKMLWCNYAFDLVGTSFMRGKGKCYAETNDLNLS